MSSRLYDVINALASWATSPPLTTTTESGTDTVPRGGYKAINISQTKTGYTPIGVVGINTGGSAAGYVALVKYSNSISGSTITTQVGLINTNANSDANPTITLTCLWLKTLGGVVNRLLFGHLLIREEVAA